MFKRGLFVGLILILLQSCQATNKAMIGEKRSETKDEFFIEKKNPLSMPPDFNELPEPSDNKDISTNKSSNNLEETLNLKSKKKKTILKKDKNKSLEKRILEKIN